MLDPAIGNLIVGCFVLLWVSAAAHKLRDLEQFAEVFAGYGLASAINRWRLSWLVPVLELALAAGLLPTQSRAAAAALGAGLLLSYASAIAINLRAGRNLIACGCGGRDQRRPIAEWMVWRNVLLAALLGLAMLPWSGREIVWIDRATIGFGGLALALLYASAQRLLGELGQVRASATQGAP